MKRERALTPPFLWRFPQELGILACLRCTTRYHLRTFPCSNPKCFANAFDFASFEHAPPPRPTQGNWTFSARLDVRLTNDAFPLFGFVRDQLTELSR